MYTIYSDDTGDLLSNNSSAANTQESSPNWFAYGIFGGVATLVIIVIIVIALVSSLLFNLELNIKASRLIYTFLASN